VADANQRRARRTGLRTIDRVQRRAAVRVQLEDAIRRGDIAPGERLPSERELVEAFGVSRVSVREAIRSLEAQGRVRVEQGRGVFVSDRRSGFGEPLSRWLEQHQDEVVELQRVRGALDALAAECVVETFTVTAVGAIADVHQAFLALVEDEAAIEELAELDVAFHLAIAEASGNRLLYDLLSDLHTYLAQSRHLVLASAERRAQSAAEHGRIVDAVLARDSAAAYDAAAAHVRSVRAFLAGVTSTPASGGPA
jgi:DNA-binding FadR family transcriptional regulator